MSREMTSDSKKDKSWNCMADYWVSKKVTLFSRTGVRVHAVFDDLNLYPHVANANWFYNNKFNFIVLNRMGDTTIFKDKI
ncbi:hypothetical protein CNR22_07495 [Sphingobacteriaceae bacterium]|nr:hypothetical protein CNR22_07495 [Sphingobacteriaceae bacterium]